MPMGRGPSKRGKKGYPPPKRRYYIAIGLPSVKIVADKHRHAV